MTLSQSFVTLKAQLGTVGVAALAILFATAWFYMTTVSALKARLVSLEQQLEHRGPVRSSPDLRLIRASPPRAKLAAFYRFFEREETAADWLAKIYTIAKAVGIELQSADYRLTAMPARLDRYQVAIPMRGTSAQIRPLAHSALSEIPVMSLDQITFKRKLTSESLAEAEVVLSLYLPRDEAHS